MPIRWARRIKVIAIAQAASLPAVVLHIRVVDAHSRCVAIALLFVHVARLVRLVCAWREVVVRRVLLFLHLQKRRGRIAVPAILVRGLCDALVAALFGLGAVVVLIVAALAIWIKAANPAGPVWGRRWSRLRGRRAVPAVLLLGLCDALVAGALGLGAVVVRCITASAAWVIAANPAGLRCLIRLLLQK